MKVGVEHRAVKRGDVRACRHRLMQRRDVAEADDGTRVARDGVVVDAIEDAHCAISAAREEKRIEFIRVEKLVEGFEPLIVAAGEIAMLAVMGDVVRKGDARAARFEIALRLFDAFELGGRGCREDCDSAIWRDRPGFD